jgi:broad specificity phosphatase PhoE
MLENNEFNLYLIRHGQSTTNETPDLMGQEADTPLSARGSEQAWHLGERLACEKIIPNYIYSSTYTRAHDTAKIAMSHFRNHPEIKLTEDLREYSAGDWTGASRKETLTLPVRSKMNLLSSGFLPPNGESLHQVERRASKWLEDNILYSKEIIEASRNAKATGKDPINIFCFSHGMTIKSLLHYVMGFDQSFTWKINIDNTSITKLYFGEYGWSLLGINDHSHILGV